MARYKVRETLVTCPKLAGTLGGGGINAGAYRGGSLELSHFVSSFADLCGIQVALDGTVDLHDGVVSRCPIGACVNVPGYDVLRLIDEVSYINNGKNIEATAAGLPVPEPAPFP